MTYGELRRLFMDVARSDRRFMVWSARGETHAAPSFRADPGRDWAVVLTDTWRGQTIEVRSYARLMADFPALPAKNVAGLNVRWHADEALVDGRMSWADVRLAQYAVEQAYPTCQLEAIEHGAGGWSCLLACPPSVHPSLATIPDALVDVYVPGDEFGYVTALTLEAAKTVASRCH